MDGFNKLDCYITLIWKSMPVKNNLAYWDHSYVKRKNEVFRMLHLGPMLQTI